MKCPKCEKELSAQECHMGKCLSCGMTESEQTATAPVDSPTTGSMLNCYAAFMDRFPEHAHKYPDYSSWICSDGNGARTFRQGWASAFEQMKSNVKHESRRDET